MITRVPCYLWIGIDGLMSRVKCLVRLYLVINPQRLSEFVQIIWKHWLWLVISGVDASLGLSLIMAIVSAFVVLLFVNNVPFAYGMACQTCCYRL
jgi:hypothetical protein